MAETYRTGDPYKLAGNRLVFTNWFYIDSETGHDWTDERGKFPNIMSNYPPEDQRIKWKAKHPNYGIRLSVQKALKTGPLFQNDRPWDKKGVSATILKDEGVYRAWCTTGWHFDRNNKDNCWCYMESDDGYNWKKPDCNLVEYDGSKKNNILTRECGWQIHSGGVFIDPSARSEERYKWINEEHFDGEAYDQYVESRPDEVDFKAVRNDVKSPFSNIRAGESDRPLYIGVRGAVSPDGIHWNFIKEPLVLTHSDIHVTCYFDKLTNKYVAYFRDYMIGPQADVKVGNIRWAGWKRAVGRAETEDFRSFPLPKPVLVPDLSWSPNCQLYTNTRTSIPGAPDHHLMFPSVWDTGDDGTFAVMASSYDGRIWQYIPGGPLLEASECGKWDGAYIFTYPELLELPNGDFALPYTGYNVPHKYPRGMAERNVGYAVWPKARLAGIQADEEGEFSTVAFLPPGEKILINAVTKRAGYIKVEVCDIDGLPVPGREFENAEEIFGDCYKRQIVWNGYDKPGFDRNTGLILRFRMRRAAIYGLEFV